MPNRLQYETSPYLLQHAHNPVDWHPWGDEALALARARQQPILVSIGYAACHWCHVMEKESFEDPATAAIMNEYFINIKIDREERPDLDQLFMDAVQAMTGSGGWPLNLFLTPDGRPFYGGTYFPPEARYNRPSWTDLLRGVQKAWQERRGELENQAENLLKHLQQSGDPGSSKPAEARVSVFQEESIHAMALALMKTADKIEGGFGQAPKFPQTGSLSFLLYYAKQYNDKAALDQVRLSLDKMMAGGIYDQLGGGLARYATDNAWLVPHFEKMLYDQAQWVALLSDAYRMTGVTDYARVIHQTMEFVQRELSSPEGGFYASLDADSEGVEGKYYVWEAHELKETLGEEAALAMDWLGVTEEGNWEAHTILTRRVKMEELAVNHQGTVEEIARRLGKIEANLLAKRQSRPRPALDDKQILSWNALMNMACSKAFAATGCDAYRSLAVNNMNWMLRVFLQETGHLCHTYKNRKAKFPGFLDDYAYLVQALICLQEITGNQAYLETARSLTEKVLEAFSESSKPLMYYTPEHQKDILVRKKEVVDVALPSGNAVMVLNLYYLGRVFDKQDWEEASANMLESIGEAVVRYPGSFSNWALEIFRTVCGCAEIVVLGKDVEEVRTEIIANFIPFKILQSATQENDAYPLLRHKPSEPDTLIYVCQNYRCQKPVVSVGEMLRLL